MMGILVFIVVCVAAAIGLRVIDILKERERRFREMERRSPWWREGQ